MAHTKTENIPKSALRFREDDSPVAMLSSEDAGAEKQRKFSMFAHSGKIMANHWLWGNLAIDLSGISIGRKRKPALRDHDSNRIVGWTEAISIDEKQGVIAEGIFSEKTEDGREALDLADEGFPWQASIYIPPLAIERVREGESATVNGRTLKGPGTIFRKSVLREVSFCALGADEHTSATALSSNGETIDVDVEIIETNKQEVNEMELSELTVEMLKKERSDLVDALSAEHEENGVKKERTRVLSLLKEARNFPGMEVALTEAVEKGESVEAALGTFKDKRLAELEKNSPSRLGPDRETPARSGLSHLDRAKAYKEEHGGSMTDALKATAEKKNK